MILAAFLVTIVAETAENTGGEQCPPPAAYKEHTRLTREAYLFLTRQLLLAGLVELREAVAGG